MQHDAGSIQLYLKVFEHTGLDRAEYERCAGKKMDMGFMMS